MQYIVHSETWILISGFQSFNCNLIAKQLFVNDIIVIKAFRKYKKLFLLAFYFKNISKEHIFYLSDII